MNTDIHARGFTMTPAIRAAVEREAQELHRRLPRRIGALAVRLFDVNGTRGGIDKGCLVHARLVRNGPMVVATAVDTDFHRAIADAFARLQRGARTVLDRARPPRRGTEPPGAAPRVMPAGVAVLAPPPAQVAAA